MVSNDVNAHCWSDEYLLSHCEDYRVADETGNHLGFVDRVIWSSEPFGEAEALVVRLSERQQLITIPLEQVKAVKPWSEIVVASPRFASRRPPKSSRRAATTTSR
jgi:ribosomal 30S subunit maturation factor RimM